MSFRQCILLFAAMSISAALVACGGSSMNRTPPPPISISFSSAAPASLQVDATASLAVSVANDSANAGVKWSVACASTGACGSFSTSGPGASTTYTAPSALPSVTNSSVVVTATSVADNTKSVSATIGISASGIDVSFSSAAYPPNALQSGGSASVAAVVTGDPSNNGVLWSATCGLSNVPCGSFSPSETPSGSVAHFSEAAIQFVGSNVTVERPRM